MRKALTTAVLFATAFAAPDFVLDFTSPFSDLSQLDNNTIGDAAAADGNLELLKRANCAAAGYPSCDNLGHPDICCRTNEVCSADQANHVACCRLGAACTGTISAGIPGTATVPTTVFASTTTTTVPPTGSFQQTGVAPTGQSYLPNQYYPLFGVIPTTYSNAAACSSAYTTCQRDAQQCTSALANGVPGVTVSAPGGGATITAIASLGQVSASAICSSLSSQACSGLIVEACASFGNAAMTRCAPMYGVGAGVAVGIAGQLLG